MNWFGIYFCSVISSVYHSLPIPLVSLVLSIQSSFPKEFPYVWATFSYRSSIFLCLKESLFCPCLRRILLLLVTLRKISYLLMAVFLLRNPREESVGGYELLVCDWFPRFLCFHVRSLKVKVQFIDMTFFLMYTFKL